MRLTTLISTVIIDANGELMFNFKDKNFKKLSREAKSQGYELNKLYANDEGKGSLIYRGFFGGKNNFAYARLDSIDTDTDLYKNLFFIHGKFKKYM